MAQRLSYQHKKTQSAPTTFVSGDRVICKNTQYTTKTGKGKFETKDGALVEYRVVSVSQGIVEVEVVGTGQKLLKHEANLKMMPRVMPAEDSCASPEPTKAETGTNDQSHPQPSYSVGKAFAVVVVVVV